MTPTAELASMYFNCVNDLAKTCNQKVCELTEDKIEGM